MAANECIPTKAPGDSFTAKCGAAVTGKRFVKISAVRSGGGLNGLSTDTLNLYVIAPCSATTDVPIGVAANDQAINLTVEVFGRGGGIIIPITAGATITAGQQIQTDASGQAIPLAAGVAVGVAMDSAASAADCEVKLF